MIFPRLTRRTKWHLGSTVCTHLLRYVLSAKQLADFNFLRIKCTSSELPTPRERSVVAGGARASYRRERIDATDKSQLAGPASQRSTTEDEMLVRRPHLSSVTWSRASVAIVTASTAHVALYLMPVSLPAVAVRRHSFNTLTAMAMFLKRQQWACAEWRFYTGENASW